MNERARLAERIAAEEQSRLEAQAAADAANAAYADAQRIIEELMEGADEQTPSTACLLIDVPDAIVDSLR